jgi:integrase
MTKVTLKFINAFANKRRKDARLRYYFRRKGQPAIPLPGAPGSHEFNEAYADALAATEPELGASRTAPGTIDALVVNYYSSTEWHRLNEETKRLRKIYLEKFREQYGHCRVATLQNKDVRIILDRIEKPVVRRHWLFMLRSLMKVAIPSLRSDDPTAGIKIAHKTRPHHTWTSQEIEQYRSRWPLGTQQRLVMELALETVSRRGELVRLGPQHIEVVDGIRKIRIQRIHGSADSFIEVTPELGAAIDAIPRQHALFITTKDGAPRSKRGLGVDSTVSRSAG